MRRIVTALASALAMAACVVVLVARQSHTPAGAAAPAATGSVSPVFGVNMSLFDGRDELATNPATQALLRSWGIPLVRVPLRAGMSDAVLTEALQAVAATGATPVVILPGPRSGTLAGDRHLLDLVTGVFGDRRVYLEYGNEQDLAGVDAPAYTASWNQVVAALKSAAPAAYHFVGPVNFQADPAYAAAFVKAARPAPDELSWHEYVCGSTQSDAYCTDHVANWATHAGAVEAAVGAVAGHPIPFFISEWNLDPADDARYGNAGFIQPWTRTALTELLKLVPLGLAGAMVYTATDHGDFGLIDGGKVTPQGAVFRDVLTSVAVASPAPSGTASSGAAPSAGGSSAATPTASSGGSVGSGVSSGGSGGSSGGGSSGAGSSGSSGGSGGSSGGSGGSSGGGTAAASGVHVGFEDGLDGWGEYWGYSTLTLSRTGSVHYDGGTALKLTASNGNYVAAGTGSNLGALHPGSPVTFHVYAGAGGGTVRPFVMDPSSNVRWPQDEISLPAAETWFTVSFTIPSGLGTVHAVGLQLHPGSSAGGWVALDALSWPG